MGGNLSDAINPLVPSSVSEGGEGGRGGEGGKEGGGAVSSFNIFKWSS